MGKRDVVTLAKRRFRGRQILAEIAANAGVQVSDITGRSQTRYLVAQRVEFIHRAKAEEFGIITICRLLGRHHTSILHHVHGWRTRKYKAGMGRKGRRRGVAADNQTGAANG